MTERRCGTCPFFLLADEKKGFDRLGWCLWLEHMSCDLLPGVDMPDWLTNNVRREGHGINCAAWEEREDD